MLKQFICLLDRDSFDFVVSPEFVEKKNPPIGTALTENVSNLSDTMLCYYILDIYSFNKRALLGFHFIFFFIATKRSCIF